MSSNMLFGGTINLAEKALDLRARRHELIMSNVANADTPNYKAFDIMVEEALARQASPEGRFHLEQTHPDHMPAGNGAQRAVQPRQLHLSPQVTLRGDGNTVDMDREMAHLAANQLQYKASAQILAKKFQGLKSIIQGGKS